MRWSRCDARRFDTNGSHFTCRRSILNAPDFDGATQGRRSHLAQAGTGDAAIEKIQKNDFDVVITDLKLDKISGMEVLGAAKDANPQTEVIMLTGYGSI